MGADEELRALKERLAALESRTTRLEQLMETARKTSERAWNFLMRFKHHMGIAINPEDERNPMRGPKKD